MLAVFSGNMQFINGTIGLATFTFSGQDVVNGPDKGTASYSDSKGGWSGTATIVNVTGAKTADMTVQVTSTTHPDVALNSVHTFHFTDNGEAGINTGEPGSDYFTYGADTTELRAVAGNIQLHYVAS